MARGPSQNRASRTPKGRKSKPEDAPSDEKLTPRAEEDDDVVIEEGAELAPVAYSVASVPAPADRNLLTLYMNEVGKAPLLTPEQEKALAMRVHDAQDPAAARELAAANLRFVVKIAFEYAQYGARILDLIQEGNVGLLRAIRDFDPYKDVRLTTYAVYWIRSYIQDYLLRNWSIVRVGTTAAQKKLFYRLKKEQEKFEREGMRPEPKRIAHNLGVEESDVKLMQERLSGKDVSLNAPRGGDGEAEAFSLSQNIPDAAPLPSSELEAAEQGALFKKALEEFQRGLNERDQAIFRDRLLSENPKTLLEIGDEYGVSKERARQIEERLKEKLRDFLAEKYPDISVD